MSVITDLTGKVIDAATKWIPDPQAKLQYQLEVERMAHEADTTLITSQADIVKAEAANQGFLASSWRPIVMLVFTALIVARWVGWSAPNLSQAEVLELWDIVKLGLGGYVIGRSVEKIVPAVAASVAQAVQKQQ